VAAKHQANGVIRHLRQRLRIGWHAPQASKSSARRSAYQSRHHRGAARRNPAPRVAIIKSGAAAAAASWRSSGAVAASLARRARPRNARRIIANCGLLLRASALRGGIASASLRGDIIASRYQASSNRGGGAWRRSSSVARRHQRWRRGGRGNNA